MLLKSQNFIQGNFNFLNACSDNSSPAKVYLIIKRLCIHKYYIDKQFWKYIKGRRSSSTDCISDIYDGKQYAQHTANGGFLDPGTNAANLSFLINTDGVAIFRSSKVSIWPVFLVINELPPNLRCVMEFCWCVVYQNNTIPYYRNCVCAMYICTVCTKS